MSSMPEGTGREGPPTTAIPPAPGVDADYRIVAARIDYTNWRGERRIREILPLRLWFGATEWHPTPTYLLKAIDCEDGKTKDFTMGTIHQWVSG